LPEIAGATLPKVDGSDKWQKCNRSGLFNRVSKGALMLGATSGQPPGNDFAALGDKISQRFRVFVGNHQT
jgi:hypothetical protein